jgi:hypothetical protein
MIITVARCWNENYIHVEFEKFTTLLLSWEKKSLFPFLEISRKPNFIRFSFKPHFFDWDGTREYSFFFFLAIYKLEILFTHYENPDKKIKQ